MGIIIFVLIVIIFVLSFYLFLLRKEIKRTTNELKEISQDSSNILLNKEFDDKNFNELITEINCLLKSINKTEMDLYSKNESLKKMIINVAHDLRTPLTSAIGYIDFCKNNEISQDEKEKYIEIIEERLNKLSYLITNFFDFSKFIFKNEEVEVKKENLVEILESTIANFYDDYSKYNRKIDFNCDINKLEILTNRILLIRIFDNLIINAYKHSNSNLTINMEKLDNNIRIEFVNVLEDKDLDVNLIFNEFYTSDISRTKENTGLGLAIAKEFVEMLNGKIYAEKNNNFLKIIIIMKS